jgi:glutamate decarboxylase
MENLPKNLADNDEYPAMLHLHQRCVSMLGNLWGAAGNGVQAIGTATTGSSEAILLGGLAMKRRWYEKQQAKGIIDCTPSF